MVYLEGEVKWSEFWVDFDCCLKMEFYGFKIILDVGLIVY